MNFREKFVKKAGRYN